MLKSASVALALLIGASALVPTVASAESCHYCVMEPIVVIGERKKKTTQTSGQLQVQQQVLQPAAKSLGARRK